MIGKNNPFNIRVSNSNRWLGSDGSTRGFCNFKTLEYGVRAACIIIMRSYRKMGVLTIFEIVNRFAPPSENDTNAYIDYICYHLGCFPFNIPSSDEFPFLLSRMSRFEGNPVSIDFVKKVIKDFNINVYGKRR